MINKKLIYRKSPNSSEVLNEYEIGELDEPRTTDWLWCDRRVCQGFWGEEEKVKDFINKINTANGFIDELH